MLKLQAIGHMGKDATKNEVNGKTVINFSIAHTEKFKDAQGNQKDKTTWVECSFWTDKTGVLPYLVKGAQIYVEGTPEVRTYQTNDGKQGASLSLRVQNIQLLGKSEASGQGAAPVSNQGNAQNNTQSFNEPADDLPF